MKIAETLSGKIANSFIGYLHLASWLKVRLGSFVSGRGVREFSSVETFWARSWSPWRRPSIAVKAGVSGLE